jgi:Mrp family chromosome partitioning ATPase
VVPDDRRDASTLRDYVRVVRRRKWLILEAVVLVPLLAVLFSLHQQRMYQGSAQVLLNRQNLAASLNGLQDPNTYIQPDRFAQTQADVARVPEVAKRVLARLGLTHRTPGQFLAASSAAPAQNADLLQLRVKDHKRRLAERLASAYAQEFTAYQRQITAAPYERAQREVRQRLGRLNAAGGRTSPLHQSLEDKYQQLRTMEALQTPNYVVRGAEKAVQVQPRPVRNGILGFALGLVLGVGLAFLWEALDTRVRSADEVAERLGLPLLARIPAPARRLRNSNRLVMVEAPSSPAAEAFRLLRTNVEFTNLEREARTIMVSSAVEAEGKSTTVANLAAAFARAGKRVVLIDLDLRRPFIHKFFELDAPGVTEVALGAATFDNALAPILIGSSQRGHSGNGNGGNGRGRVEYVLDVMAAGPAPPNPGEFVGTQRLAEILDEVGRRADIVLIDAPPLLHLGDAVTLSAKVDALLVVTRLNVVRRPMLMELHRVLETCPAAKLGVIVTGADADEEHNYAGYYRYHSVSEEVFA